MEKHLAKSRVKKRPTIHAEAFHVGQEIRKNDQLVRRENFPSISPQNIFIFNVINETIGVVNYVRGCAFLCKVKHVAAGEAV